MSARSLISFMVKRRDRTRIYHGISKKTVYIGIKDKAI